QRVARAYLRPDRLSVVLVGNASAFGSALKGVGFNTYETVEIGKLDLTAADFKGPGKPAVPAAAPRFRAISRKPPLAYQPSSATGAPAAGQDGARAKMLLERAIAAKGGLDTLRSVKRITAKTTTSMMGPQGRVQAEA